MQETYTILAALFGLLFGSFYNVVAIRTAKKESIAYPPSHCVHCNHELKPLDLIPVLSYVGLRGRCRYCKEGVSPIYPIGEGITAFLFALLTCQMYPSAELGPALFFISILIITALSDIRYMIIPDRIVFFGIAVTAILRIWIHPLPYWEHVAGLLVGGGIIYLIGLIAYLLLKKEAMGGGDLKLFAFIGFFVGIKITLITLFIASLLGTLYGIILIVTGKYERNRVIPFGPFISAGAVIAYIWGEQWLELYLSLVFS